MMEELKETEASFNRNAPITLSGQVIDPLTCLPVEGATITSGSVTLTTDADGNFQESVNTDDLGNVFTVEKEEHISYEFAVNFKEFDGNIRIDLPERQNCVWVGRNEGAWYKVTTNDGCVEYIVDMFGSTFEEWTEVCIGPGGNAYGAGIDEFFAQPSVSIETPDNPNAKIVKLVDVRFDPRDLLAAGKKSSCLSPGSSIAAACAAGVTDQTDILSVLYGVDNNTITKNGDVVIKVPTQGTVIPGVGIIHTHEDFTSGFASNTAESRNVVTSMFICHFLPDGSLGPPIPVILDENGDLPDFPGVPHQSVPDGDG